jgi:hypothetical protein
MRRMQSVTAPDLQGDRTRTVKDGAKTATYRTAAVDARRIVFNITFKYQEYRLIELRETYAVMFKINLQRENLRIY